MAGSSEKLVTHYWLNYDIIKTTVRISVKTDDSGWQGPIELPPEKALFVSDMLRNEKPIYLTMDEDGNPISLHTREEPTGEGELT